MKEVIIIRNGWNCDNPGESVIELTPDDFAHLVAGYVLEGYSVHSYIQSGYRVIVASVVGETHIIKLEE